nr:MAG TPA: hypothetical protein [Caudoviricetes sp.]
MLIVAIQRASSHLYHLFHIAYIVIITNKIIFVNINFVKKTK